MTRIVEMALMRTQNKSLCHDKGSQVLAQCSVDVEAGTGSGGAASASSNDKICGNWEEGPIQNSHSPEVERSKGNCKEKHISMVSKVYYKIYPVFKII